MNQHNILYIFLFFFYAIYVQSQEKSLENKKIIKNPKDSTVAHKPDGDLRDKVKATSDNRFNDLVNQMTFLRENAQVNYEDIEIKAGYITIDWNTATVKAYPIRDSLGKKVDIPIFKHGTEEVEYETFSYNFKTKKGAAQNIRTNMEGGVVIAKEVLRLNDSVSLSKGVKWTTDTYFVERKDSVPDYYIKTPKLKRIQNKLLVTGPAQIVISEIPTPLILPFTLLPDTKRRSAGILMPNVGENSRNGFFMERLGFYWPINNYIDLTAISSFYSRGSWLTSLNSNYKRRYLFSGSLLIDYENRVYGTLGLSDYRKARFLNLRWNHSPDNKSNPYFKFSANVNFSSSGDVYKGSIKQENYFNSNVLRNNIQSSVNLNKIWPKGLFSSLNSTLTLSHDLTQKRMRFSLPSFTLSMRRKQPFRSNQNDFLKNLNIDYSLSGQNRIDIHEKNAFKKAMLDSALIGLNHRASASTNTKLARYFNWNISANYNEVWVLETLRKELDPLNQKVINKKQKGFSGFRTFSFSNGITTNLYKTLHFKNSRLKAIRHVITPAISHNYNPDFSSDFWGYYANFIDQNGKTVRYNRFEGGIYGSPMVGESNAINISIGNNIEAKWISKKDSATKEEKIKLLESLNISSSYNFAAKTFRWGNIAINGSSSLFKGNLGLGFNANFDPYQYKPSALANTAYERVEKLGFPTLRYFRITANYKINNQTFSSQGQKKESDKTKFKRKGYGRYESYSFDDDGYAHYSIPWHMGFDLGYSKRITPGLKSEKLATIGINADISPTPFWKFSVRSGYDFKTKKITYTSISIDRDLRSFRLNFSWVPLGIYQTYSFFIGIKADILKDLKYETRNFPEENPPF